MADASYVIDIAASMPEGEATNAQLDAMVQGLTGAGKGADFFQQAIKQVSASLDAAKAASAAANGALAEGNAQYKELEKAANVAAKAVERASAKGAVDPALAARAHEADAALASYAQTLKGLEHNAAAATKGEAQLATQLSNVKKLAGHVDKSFTSNAEKLSKLQGSLGAVGGPLGSLGSKIVAPVKGFEELSGAIGKSNAAMLLGAAATVGVVVAIAAITAAAIAGTIAIAAWAVSLADASRSAKLASDAAAVLSPELNLLRGNYAALTAQTGVGSKALDGIAKSLEAAKVSAEDMPAALQAAALAEAALGAGGANEFIAKMKEAKGGVRAFSDQTTRSLGGIVAKQMMGLDAQAARFKANIGTLFGGLNIDPVLRGLERLGALFDENTAAGQTIKFLFESIFQPLIDQADKASIVIEAFALGFLIGLTKLYIALKPAIKAVSEFFGFKDTSLSDVLDLATKAGEYAAYIFVGFVAAVGMIAGVVGAAVAAMLIVPTVIAALIGALGFAAAFLVDTFMGAWNSVAAFFSGLDLVSIGGDLIMGLVNGIANMGPNVLKAITGVVGGAIDAAKHLLGIASPSKVFAEIGTNTGAGFAGGVEDSTDTAQAAMTDMVDPAPAAAKAGGAGAAGSGGSSGKTVHIENLYLAGSKATPEETQSLSEALTRLLEGDASQLGAEMAPA